MHIQAIQLCLKTKFRRTELKRCVLRQLCHIITRLKTKFRRTELKPLILLTSEVPPMVSKPNSVERNWNDTIDFLYTIPVFVSKPNSVERNWNEIRIDTKEIRQALVSKPNSVERNWNSCRAPQVSFKNSSLKTKFRRTELKRRVQRYRDRYFRVSKPNSVERNWNDCYNSSSS